MLKWVGVQRVLQGVIWRNILFVRSYFQCFDAQKYEKTQKKSKLSTLNFQISTFYRTFAPAFP
jgi:hypothetical protein